MEGITRPEDMATVKTIAMRTSWTGNKNDY